MRHVGMNNASGGSDAMSESQTRVCQCHAGQQSRVAAIPSRAVTRGKPFCTASTIAGRPCIRPSDRQSPRNGNRLRPSRNVTLNALSNCIHAGPSGGLRRNTHTQLGIDQHDLRHHQIRPQALLERRLIAAGGRRDDRVLRRLGSRATGRGKGHDRQRGPHDLQSPTHSFKITFSHTDRRFLYAHTKLRRPSQTDRREPPPMARDQVALAPAFKHSQLPDRTVYVARIWLVRNALRGAQPVSRSACKQLDKFADGVPFASSVSRSKAPKKHSSARRHEPASPLLAARPQPNTIRCGARENRIELNRSGHTAPDAPPHCNRIDQDFHRMPDTSCRVVLSLRWGELLPFRNIVEGLARFVQKFRVWR